MSDHFDYLALHPIWRGPGATIGGQINNYDWPVTIVQSNKKGEITVPIYTADATRHYVCFVVDRVDHSKVEALGQGAPAWFYYKARTLKLSKTGALSDAAFQKILPLVRHIQYKFWGCLAGKDAVIRYFHILLAPFLKPERETNQTWFGPCDGRPGWALQCYPRSQTQAKISPLRTFIDSVNGTLPVINIVSKSRVCIAYVMQQGYISWSNGEGQLNAWQAMIEAADAVDVLRPQIISIAKILDEYCCCRSPEARSRMAHYCMICWVLSLCSNCVKLEDGRTVCQECVTKHGTELPADFTLTGGLRAYIRRSTLSAYYRDAESAGRAKEPTLLADLRAKLEESITDVALDQWKDAWNGLRLWSDAVYTDTLLRSVKRAARTVTHPLNCSIEAPYPFCLVGGVVYYHHPDNIVLTAWGLNALHGNYPIFILPWCRLAVEHIEREYSGEDQDDSFWSSFDNAMDNAMRIGNMTPHSLIPRLKQKLKNADYEDLVEMWKTGRPSVQDPIFSYAPDRSSTEFSKWDSEDVKRIDALVRAFERLFPQHPLPRSASGAPWPLRIDHMPEDWTYDDAFVFFSGKYRRAKIWCNSENETKESPDNFFLACIIWFLKTGGKDEFFNCSLTIYSRHPFTLSVGRASNVLPGSPMATGFTCLHPSSIDDYNPLLCSITFEGLLTNRYKHNFDISLFKTALRDLIKSIPFFTAWYDAPVPDLPVLRFPSTLRTGRITYRGPQDEDSGDESDNHGGDGGGGGGSGGDDDDVDGEDEIEDDDTFHLLNDQIDDEDDPSFDPNSLVDPPTRPVGEARPPKKPRLDGEDASGSTAAETPGFTTAAALLAAQTAAQANGQDGGEQTAGADGQGGQIGQGDRDGQGQSGQQTGQQLQVVGASLIEADPLDIEISDLVAIDHPLYGRALATGDHIGWPTTENLFIDQDGTVVGFFMQSGPVIRVGVQVAVMNGTLPAVPGDSGNGGDANGNGNANSNGGDDGDDNGNGYDDETPSDALLEAILYDTRRLKITQGKFSVTFVQHNPSGEGLRCLWRAVAHSWSGSDSDAHLTAIQERVNALLLNVLYHSKGSAPENLAQQERGELYRAMNENNPGTLTDSVLTMEMGKLIRNDIYKYLLTRRRGDGYRSAHRGCSRR